jgi:hypothetical protein
MPSAAHLGIRVLGSNHELPFRAKARLHSVGIRTCAAEGFFENVLNILRSTGTPIERAEMFDFEPFTPRPGLQMS